MIVLAKSLEAWGHTVQILTNANLVKKCEAKGINAVAAFADTEWMIRESGGLRGEGHAGIRNMSKKMDDQAQKWAKVNTGCVRLTDPWDALQTFNPDLTMCVWQSTQHALRYESERGVPMVMVHLSKVSLELYRDYLQLEPPRPTFVAVSKVLEKDLSTVPEGVIRTGEWAHDEFPSAADLSEGGALHELNKFLDQAARRPVAIGWGSMMPEGMAPIEMLKLSLSALHTAGVRGVITGGWARLHELGQQLLDGTLQHEDNFDKLDAMEWKRLADFAREKVFFVSEAPHAWLLPRCTCLVSHGGAGTVHAASRAGTPSVVTPIFADQFSSAAMIDKLGAGVGFNKALPQITSEELAAAIVTAEGKSFKAASLGKKMRQENGAERAAQEINKFLSSVRGGQWVKDRRPRRS
jgi:hypothetical protein